MVNLNTNNKIRDSLMALNKGKGLLSSPLFFLSVNSVHLLRTYSNSDGFWEVTEGTDKGSLILTVLFTTSYTLLLLKISFPIALFWIP